MKKNIFSFLLTFTMVFGVSSVFALESPLKEIPTSTLQYEFMSLEKNLIVPERLIVPKVNQDSMTGDSPVIQIAWSFRSVSSKVSGTIRKAVQYFSPPKVKTPGQVGGVKG